MSDEEIQGFIDYFGEDNIPNPDHYPQRVLWLMKWYRYIVERNRRENEKDECKDYTGQ
jgi:hypothetical protein